MTETGKRLIEAAKEAVAEVAPGACARTVSREHILSGNEIGAKTLAHCVLCGAPVLLVRPRPRCIP